MGEQVGYVVVEYNQASHRAGLVLAADIHDDLDDAQHEADAMRAVTESVGRRERYAVAELTLVDDPR